MLRIVLGVVFVYAAWLSCGIPGSCSPWRSTPTRLLPHSAVELVARTLPWFELVLGLAADRGLLAARHRHGRLAAAAGFFTLIVRAWAKGMEINCGCFGPGDAISWKTILRDGSLLAGLAVRHRDELCAGRARPRCRNARPGLARANSRITRSSTRGFAQSHFARPAVRALRRHMVERILRLTGAGRGSRVLSLGCGIGDTELLLAPHVAEVVGVDLSPAAIRQARADAAAPGHRQRALRGGRRRRGPLRRGDGHLLPAPPAGRRAGRSCPAAEGVGWRRAARSIRSTPAGGGLSGAVGRLLIPGLMKRYQTPDERELEPEPRRSCSAAPGSMRA